MHSRSYSAHGLPHREAMESHRMEMRQNAEGENRWCASLHVRRDDAENIGSTGIGIHAGNSFCPGEQRSANLGTGSQWGRHCTSSLPLPRWLLWQTRPQKLARQSLGLDSIKLEFRLHALVGPPLLLQYASSRNRPNEVTSVCHDFENMLVSSAARTVHARPVQRFVHVIER